MSITISGIPVGVRTPGAFINFDNTRANQGLPAWPVKMLALGQMFAGGTAAPLTPIEIISAPQANVLFGQGSMLARMCAAILANNSTTPFFAMGVLDNVAGTAQVQTVTFTGPATAAGTLPIYIGAQQTQTAVNAADTAAAIATNFAATVNADADLPVTAAAAGAVVTLTTRWKGLVGGALSISGPYYSSDAMPAGVTMAVAIATPGAGNPAVGPALAALGPAQYNFIAFPWTDGANLAALATEMANRRGPMEQIEGMAFSCAFGTLSQLQALGATMNSPDISISETLGPATPWERCARECAVIAFYGSINPALPLKTLALAGDMADFPAQQLTRAERDLLLHDGISTHTVDPGGNVLLERPITTYQFNAAGLPDPSYLDVPTLLTLSYLRYTLRAMIATKYPRFGLAQNGTPIAPGVSIVTPAILSAELVALAQLWEADGLVQNLAGFQSQLYVEIDGTDPTRVNAIIPPDIIPGFNDFAGDLQFAF